MEPVLSDPIETIQVYGKGTNSTDRPTWENSRYSAFTDTDINIGASLVISYTQKIRRYALLMFADTDTDTGRGYIGNTDIHPIHGKTADTVPLPIPI